MNKTLLTLALLAAATTANAEPWKYSGNLNDGGAPANGRYDMRLTLLDAAKAMSVGSPVTLYAVDVHDGAFTVAVDFGVDLVNAPAMQLQTEVSKGSSGFVALGEPTRFDPKAALAGVCWDTEGNSGTNPATNFIGTTDNQPLVIRANNVPVLRIFPRVTSPNTVAGATGNSVNGSSSGQVIAGGGTSSSNCGTSGTGTCLNSTIGEYSVVGGGKANKADSYGTVAGGSSNVASNNSSTVGGGYSNTANADISTVSGGQSNLSSGFAGSVGGGRQNQASGNASTVSGGEGNIASAFFSTVGGGQSNTASGFLGTVTGGLLNCAGGDYSWAGGTQAKIRPGNEAGDGNCVANSGTTTGDNGTFMWADSQTTNFVSTGPNQFLVRAAGGVMFNTNSLPNSGADDLVVAARPSGSGGDEDADVVWLSRSNKSGRIYLSDGTGGFIIALPDLGASSSRLVVAAGTGGNASLSNGGVWTNASSREFKTGFAPVNPLELLTKVIGLPLSTWTYKGSLEGTHLGPMAEDFKAAFGLAGDGKTIGTVDADGVALAAIQGLNQKLESENAALKARLNTQDARLRALEAKLK